MFSNPVKPSADRDEGTIVQVDSIRKTCRVKTVSGQSLNSVSWATEGGANRSGCRRTPHAGERVLIEHGLGYPVIVRFLTKVQSEDETYPLSIDSGEVLIDTGNYSPDGMNAYGDTSAPRDMLGGDIVHTSLGGGMLALLRGGSAILRSGKMAQVFLSKYDDLVRIVSRNWEQFTDACSDVIRNIEGKVYRYTGYATTLSASRDEDYNLHFYYGDTATAEAVKTDYHNSSSQVETTDIIYKEQVTKADDRSELMRRTLNDKGEEERYIKGENFTRSNATAKLIRDSYNDEHYIEITPDHIEGFHKDSAKQTLDSKGQRLYFKDGTVDMNESTISIKKGGSEAVLDTSTITLTTGGTKFVMDGSSIVMTAGGVTATLSSGGFSVS